MGAGLVSAIVLTVVLFAYVFWPQRRLLVHQKKTRLDYLDERKSAVYDNLRDLQFEYQAGKYPEEDFRTQRDSLENEASEILLEMDRLGSGAAQEGR